jgi:hypothetical protein
LERAELIISLCRFFHKLPSEILAEDVEILQLVRLYELAHPGEDSSDG